MFTGIVEEVGTVRALSARSLTIRARTVLEGLRLGDSISVNGVCLTVTAIEEEAFVVGLMPETLRRSNLGRLRAGEAVNLERALPADGRLGGHFVQGHVDATGALLAVWDEGPARWLRISAPPEVARYLVPKGFIAVDGVSLTVVDCDEGSFTVSLVGYTQEHVTLSRRRPGYLVNLEADVLGKYVERLVSGRTGGGRITPEFLAANGFE